MSIAAVRWTIVLLIGATTIGLSYLIYPRIEQLIVRTFRNYLDWVTETMGKMFLPVKRSNVAVAITTSTLAMALLGFSASRGYGPITLLMTLFFGWIGWSVVRFWVSMRWNFRLQKFDTQLVDGLNLMANSLKSGLNLSQAIQVLVQEMPNPLSQEFGVVISQEKIGLTTDDALEKMLERIPSEDLSIAVHSILILRETGGDLSETFEVIASTIRERRKVDGKIKSLTAQGKMQGLILFIMPFGLATMLYFTNPAYITPLFTTQLGWLMILVMLFFQIIGGLWLMKIIRIEV